MTVRSDLAHDLLAFFYREGRGVPLRQFPPRLLHPVAIWSENNRSPPEKNSWKKVSLRGRGKTVLAGIEYQGWLHASRRQH